MFDLQDQFVFPRHAVGVPGPLPKAAKRLTLRTADGEILHGLHIEGSGTAGRLIIGFAGNAWNSQDAASYLHELYPSDDIVQFHYRGYRPSTGTPSAEALLSDALLIHDDAVRRWKPKKVVAVGFSIGSGVAAHLASKRRIDGAILVTPFDSLKNVASEQVSWLPVKLLFKHEMDAAVALSNSDTPVAIIAAANDQLIGARRTDALRKRVHRLSYNRTIEGAGHNDIYRRSEFHQAMREALAAVSS